MNKHIILKLQSKSISDSSSAHREHDITEMLTFYKLLKLTFLIIGICIILGILIPIIYPPPKYALTLTRVYYVNNTLTFIVENKGSVPVYEVVIQSKGESIRGMGEIKPGQQKIYTCSTAGENGYVAGEYEATHPYPFNKTAIIADKNEYIKPLKLSCNVTLMIMWSENPQSRITDIGWKGHITTQWYLITKEGE